MPGLFWTLEEDASYRRQEKADYREKEFSESDLAEIYAILELEKWQYVGRDGKPMKHE